MGSTYDPRVLIFIAVVIQVLAVISAKSHGDKLMVAFICGKPAVHYTEKGWARDERTDCLNKPYEILEYCKKVYPKEDITNVVESTKRMAIPNWCAYNKKHCKHHGTHLVRPFRCLAGAFQSDALLVPEHCVFDHIHDSKQCKKFKDWNDTSFQSCVSRDMHQQSYAMLLPCGVDMFSGVEFVCCPKDQNKKQKQGHKPTHKATHQPKPRPTPKPTPKPTVYAKPQPSVEDIYQSYLHSSRLGHFVNEHQRFKAAEKTWLQHHRQKISKMMKEWAAARKRVQEMKRTDIKAAAKLNQEITQRFQKTYTALEQEGIAEKKQLISLHQQRVQALMNEKKRHAREKYMAALTHPEPEAAEILRSLERYIKTEEKDRMHTINHYQHLRDTDPEEAEHVHQQISDHLKFIQQRVQQSIEMLDRVPKYAKKIRVQVEKFMKSFHNVDVSETNILAHKIHKVDNKKILEQYKHSETHKPHHKPAVEVKPTQKVEKVETPKPVLHHVELHKQALNVHPKKYDDETEEDEHKYIDIKKPHQVHNQQANNHMVAEQQPFFKHSGNTAGQITTSGTLGITIASIAVFVLIVVGIVILRKKGQQRPGNNGFVEVDQAASPEERHVANMQINGYENPTYKYFELNGNSQQQPQQTPAPQ